MTKTASHYGSTQVGGKIFIMNSRFIDSSFTYGMLFVTPRKPLAMKAAKVLVFTYSDQQDNKKGSPQKKMNDQAYLQQKIGIYDSTFENLNYG
jgi:hypothetical protein